jgi:hypothetical protein
LNRTTATKTLLWSTNRLAKTKTFSAVFFARAGVKRCGSPTAKPRPDALWTSIKLATVSCTRQNQRSAFKAGDFALPALTLPPLGPSSSTGCCHLLNSGDLMYALFLVEPAAHAKLPD